MFGGVGESCSDLELEQVMKFLPITGKLLKSEAIDREYASKFVMLLLIVDNIYVS